MTDMEGVAGVLDHDTWVTPSGRYYEVGKELLTQEINAAVEGFFSAGATEIMVADGHGHGGINPLLLDPRVELMRGWPTGYPLFLDKSYDAVAWVGQHAKAGTENAHIAHTQWFNYIDLAINGVSIGEFGQVALCASELDIPSIFMSGDLAATLEAEQLVPGIEAVAVKRGTTPGKGDELETDDYRKRNLSAIHLHPEVARMLIREGAERALHHLRDEPFGLIKLTPPYTRTARFRADGDKPRTIAEEQHPTSIIALLNMKFERKPLGQ